VKSIDLSRSSLVLLIAGVLLTGVVLGSALPMLGDGAASPSPTPSVPASVSAELPAADVAGEDLARLPRYPGSVRTEYEISRDDRVRRAAVEYLADATLDDVRSFYQGVMAEHGWERADIAYSGGEWTYVLVDGMSEALVELEVSGGLVEIDLQISDPIESAPEGSAPPPDDHDDDDGDDDDDDD
jgi:hypothetical protein